MVPPGQNNGGNGRQPRRGGGPCVTTAKHMSHMLLPYPTDRKLSILEARFVTEFLKDMSASVSQLAIRAGYSEKTAHAIGWQVIRRPHVAAEIQDQLHAFTQRERLSIQRLVRHLIELSEVDKRAYFDDDGSLKPMSQLTRTQAALVKGFTVQETWDIPGSPNKVQTGELKKITLTDHLKPIEMLAKSLQSFVEKVEVKEHKQVDVNINHQMEINFKVLNPDELRTLKAIYKTAEERTREMQMEQVKAVGSSGGGEVLQ